MSPSGGGEGDAKRQFNVPSGIAIADDNYVYVADTNNHRIQKFDSEGEFIVMWGSHGSGKNNFIQPTGIEVDENGLIFVADKNNHRIQVFSQ